jgi:hypothetical protein
MAVTITATAGSASANSYLTLAEADALVEGMVASTDVAKWTTGTDDTVTVLLLQQHSDLIAKDS